MSKAPIVYRLLLIASAGAFLLLAVIAYHGGFYLEMFHYLGVQAVFPIFVDMSLFVDAECARLGHRVLFDNTCDPIGRVFDQSPMWLVLAYLPIPASVTPYAGGLLGTVFVAAMCWLLRPRNLTQALYCVAALLSSSVIFAVERANRDMIVILLVLAAVLILNDRRWRKAITYALVFLAGLLKFYPMSAMILAVEENWREFLVVFFASLSGLAIFVVLTYDELDIVLGRIPQAVTRDAFAAKEIVNWFALTSGYLLETKWFADSSWLRATRWGLTGLAVAASFVIWNRFQIAGIRLCGTTIERRLFIVGATMIIFSFFASQNVTYRCSILLLALPMILTTAAEGADNRQTRNVVRLLMAGVLVILWASAVHNRVDPAFDSGRSVAVRQVVWLLDELISWSTITVLLAFLWSQLATSQLFRSLRETAIGRLARRFRTMVTTGPKPRFLRQSTIGLIATFFLVGSGTFLFDVISGRAQQGMGVASITSLTFSDRDSAAAYGTGWGAFEVGSNARTWRWVAGHRAEIYLSLPMQTNSVLIFRAGTHRANPDQRIAIYVNGKRLGIAKVERAGSFLVFRVRVPGYAVDQPTSIIRFEFAEASPRNDDEDRDLAMAFESLSVK